MVCACMEGCAHDAACWMQVAFPLQLDMFDFCTDELKAKLKGPRAALRRVEDDKAGVSREDGEEAGDATDADGDAVMGGGGADFTGELTGQYELLAVLTHKVRECALWFGGGGCGGVEPTPLQESRVVQGRTPDSGHYVAWVRQEDGIWVQFDDEKMVPRKDEDVLALCGGGDWHTSYMMLWKPLRVPATSNQSAPPAEEG